MPRARGAAAGDHRGPAVVAAQHFGADGGAIINISSRAAQGPALENGPYAAAKAAVNLLAKSVAKQGGALGVKGFAVAPGAVETPLLRKLIDKNILPHAMSPDVVADEIVACVMGQRDHQNGETIFLRN